MDCVLYLISGNPEWIYIYTHTPLHINSLCVCVPTHKCVRVCVCVKKFMLLLILNIPIICVTSHFCSYHSIQFLFSRSHCSVWFPQEKNQKHLEALNFCCSSTYLENKSLIFGINLHCCLLKQAMLNVLQKRYVEAGFCLCAWTIVNHYGLRSEIKTCITITQYLKKWIQMYHSISFLNMFVNIKMNNLCPIFLIHLCYSATFDLYNHNLYSITRKFFLFFWFEEILIFTLAPWKRKNTELCICKKRERKNAL